MSESPVILVESDKEIVPEVNIYLVATGARDAYRLDIFSTNFLMLVHWREH
jgi:hypothetical protein